MYFYSFLQFNQQQKKYGKLFIPLHAPFRIVSSFLLENNKHSLNVYGPGEMCDARRAMYNFYDDIKTLTKYG